MDALLATDTAFMLGPWLAAARNLAATATVDIDGGNVETHTKPDATKNGAQTTAGVVAASDCAIFERPAACADFYEWNARVQVTTWQPTPANATQVPGGPIDYAV